MGRLARTNTLAYRAIFMKKIKCSEYGGRLLDWEDNNILIRIKTMRDKPMKENQP
jgi:hypothetical protein